MPRDGIPPFPFNPFGKEPAVIHDFRRGFLDATTDIDAINAAWSEADFNIGLLFLTLPDGLSLISTAPPASKIGRSCALNMAGL